MWLLLPGCLEITTLTTPSTTDTDTPTYTDGGPTDTALPTSPTTTAVGALTFTGPAPRRLLVISLDTTRRDHIGRFSGSGLTPNLDRVLDEAVVLEDHRSCSNWTGPSMTCVISGRTPMENGFWPWTGDPKVDGYPDRGYGDDTLPGRFTAAGFATTLVTANGVFSRDLFTSAGFDQEVRVDWQPAPAVSEAALATLDGLLVDGRPWYLHVHYIDPHGTYCAPEEYVEAEAAGLPDVGLSREEWCYDSYGAQDGAYWDASMPAEREAVRDWLEAQYAAELRYWDVEFGRFWSELERRGALEDTLVAFVTDHGQQFYERGGHGHGLYLGAEENRSTAWFWARNLAPVAFRRTTFHPDVTATLYEVFGVTPTIPQTGLTVGTAPEDRAIHAINAWDAYSIQLLVARGDRELVYDWWGSRAFYRLDDDPQGLVDVYDRRDPDLVELWAEMDTWIAEVQRSWPHLPPPVDPGP
jgi:arylsulfatase A-like enzyme